MKSKAQPKAPLKAQPRGQVKPAKSAKPQIHIGRGAIELALFEFQQ